MNGSAEERAIDMDQARQVRETWGSPLIALVCKEFEKYAAESEQEAIHIHQTRHTFARMVSEDTGSLVEVEEVLSHSNLQITRVHVQSIAMKKVKHSGRISERLGIL